MPKNKSKDKSKDKTKLKSGDAKTEAKIKKTGNKSVSTVADPVPLNSAPGQLESAALANVAKLGAVIDHSSTLGIAGTVNSVSNLPAVVEKAADLPPSGAAYIITPPVTGVGVVKAKERGQDLTAYAEPEFHPEIRADQKKSELMAEAQSSHVDDDALPDAPLPSAAILPFHQDLIGIAFPRSSDYVPLYKWHPITIEVDASLDDIVKVRQGDKLALKSIGDSSSLLNYQRIETLLYVSVLRDIFGAWAPHDIAVIPDVKFLNPVIRSLGVNPDVVEKGGNSFHRLRIKFDAVFVALEMMSKTWYKLERREDPSYEAKGEGGYWYEGNKLLPYPFLSVEKSAKNSGSHFWRTMLAAVQDALSSHPSTPSGKGIQSLYKKTEMPDKDKYYAIQYKKRELYYAPGLPIEVHLPVSKWKQIRDTFVLENPRPYNKYISHFVNFSYYQVNEKNRHELKDKIVRAVKPPNDYYRFAFWAILNIEALRRKYVLEYLSVLTNESAPYFKDTGDINARRKSLILQHLSITTKDPVAADINLLSSRGGPYDIQNFIKDAFCSSIRQYIFQIDSPYDLTWAQFVSRVMSGGILRMVLIPRALNHPQLAIQMINFFCLGLAHFTREKQNPNGYHKDTWADFRNYLNANGRYSQTHATCLSRVNSRDLSAFPDFLAGAARVPPTGFRKIKGPYAVQTQYDLDQCIMGIITLLSHGTRGEPVYRDVDSEGTKGEPLLWRLPTAKSHLFTYCNANSVTSEKWSHGKDPIEWRAFMQLCTYLADLSRILGKYITGLEGKNSLESLVGFITMYSSGIEDQQYGLLYQMNSLIKTYSITSLFLGHCPPALRAVPDDVSKWELNEEIHAIDMWDSHLAIKLSDLEKPLLTTGRDHEINFTKGLHLFEVMDATRYSPDSGLDNKHSAAANLQLALLHRRSDEMVIAINATLGSWITVLQLISGEWSSLSGLEFTSELATLRQDDWIKLADSVFKKLPHLDTNSENAKIRSMLDEMGSMRTVFKKNLTHVTDHFTPQMRTALKLKTTNYDLTMISDILTYLRYVLQHRGTYGYCDGFILRSRHLVLPTSVQSMPVPNVIYCHVRIRSVGTHPDVVHGSLLMEDYNFEVHIVDPVSGKETLFPFVEQIPGIRTSTILPEASKLPDYVDEAHLATSFGGAVAPAYGTKFPVPDYTARSDQSNMGIDAPLLNHQMHGMMAKDAAMRAFKSVNAPLLGKFALNNAAPLTFYDHREKRQKNESMTDLPTWVNSRRLKVDTEEFIVPLVHPPADGDLQQAYRYMYIPLSEWSAMTKSERDMADRLSEYYNILIGGRIPVKVLIPPSHTKVEVDCSSIFSCARDYVPVVTHVYNMPNVTTKGLRFDVHTKVTPVGFHPSIYADRMRSGDVQFEGYGWQGKLWDDNVNGGIMHPNKMALDMVMPNPDHTKNRFDDHSVMLEVTSAEEYGYLAEITS